MDVEIYVEETHWQDRAPNIELRRLEKIRQLFRNGQIEKPLLTAQITSSHIRVISDSVKRLERIQGTDYTIRGKIVAGYGNSVVIDCGVLLRVGIEYIATNQHFKISFGNYVEITARIFGHYYDNWE